MLKILKSLVVTTFLDSPEPWGLSFQDNAIPQMETCFCNSSYAEFIDKISFINEGLLLKWFCLGLLIVTNLVLISFIFVVGLFLYSDKSGTEKYLPQMETGSPGLSPMEPRYESDGTPPPLVRLDKPKKKDKSKSASKKDARDLAMLFPGLDLDNKTK